MTMTEEELKSAQLDLERERFEEDRKSKARSLAFEEKKFAAELARSKWVQLSTQLSVVIPVLTLLIGAVIERSSDSAKREHDQQQQVEKLRRDFIHRQLSSFYYPIELRLQQDDDTWHLAFPQEDDPERLKTLINQHPHFSLYIQEKVLIPNHEKILQLIEDHGDLIENGFEDQLSQQHLESLRNAIRRYREHVALYKALMENHLRMTPAALMERADAEKQRFQWPAELETSVSDRIADLYRQLRELGEDIKLRQPDKLRKPS
jgi:hypothetical protein